MTRKPGWTAVKTLFALSCNNCSFTGCDEVLTDPKWSQVAGEIAHISGENEGAARFDPDMTEDDRRGYENLMLMCPKHHKLIDRLLPNDYSVEVLREMKEKHVEHCKDNSWASEDLLDRYAELLLDSVEDRRHQAPDVQMPVLVVRIDGEHIELENLGPGDAYEVRTTNDGEERHGTLLIEEMQADRLSQGGQLRGIYARTLGDKPGASVRVEWADKAGSRTDAVFPL